MRPSTCIAGLLAALALAGPASALAENKRFCPPDQQLPCDQGTRADAESSEATSGEKVAH